MSRADIVTFLTELLGAPGRYEARHNGVLQHQADRVRAIWAFVTELPEDEQFAVVADESQCVTGHRVGTVASGALRDIKRGMLTRGGQSVQRVAGTEHQELSLWRALAPKTQTA